MAKDKSKKKVNSLSFVFLFLGLILVLALAVPFLTKEGQDSRSKVEKNQQVEKSQAGNSQNISETSLPVDFPADFPLPEDYRLEGSWTAQNNGKSGISVILKTKDSVKRVADYFEDALSKNGWETTARFDSPDSVIITFEKEGKEGFIGITKEEEATAISITVSVK